MSVQKCIVQSMNDSREIKAKSGSKIRKMYILAIGLAFLSYYSHSRSQVLHEYFLANSLDLIYR